MPWDGSFGEDGGGVEVMVVVLDISLAYDVNVHGLRFLYSFFLQNEMLDISFSLTTPTMRLESKKII